MATKKGGPKATAKKTATKHAARSKVSGLSNGMRSYALHAYDEESAGIVSKLKQETEATPSFGFVAEGAMGAAAPVDPETAARGYLSQALASKSVPSLVAPQGDTTDFKVINTETIPLTNTVMVKFRQRFSEVPVYGSLVSVELDDKNDLVSMNTALGEPVDVSPLAKKSPAEAMKAIKDYPGYKKDLGGIVPKLNYYFDTKTQKWHLTYIAEDVPVKGGSSEKSDAPFLQMMDYVVDAHTGKVLDELTRSAHMASVDETELDGLGKSRKFRADQNGSKKELFDSTLNIRTFDFTFQDIERNSTLLPGKSIGNPPKWTPAAVSAHANAAVVAEYLRNVLGRKNIDNNNGVITSSINCDLRRRNRRPAPEWINAVWNGRQMLYGQRKNGSNFISLAIALDVVGHEMFHGVTQFTSRLVYETQSGALNESYSDIFGVAIKNSGEPDVSKWDWTIGKGLLEGGEPFRDLSNPERFNQPAHMRNFAVLDPDEEHDFGGVHTNSGINNKVAFLIFTSKDNNGKFIFTPAQAAGIFYLTLTQQLTPRSQFTDARRGSLVSTRSLLRALPATQLKAATDAVEKAFDAVGVK